MAIDTEVLALPDEAAITTPRLTVVDARDDSARRWVAPGLVVGFDVLALLFGMTLVGATASAWLYGLAAAVALASAGAYRPRLSLRLGEEVPSILGRLGGTVLAVAPVAALTGGTGALPVQAAL